jgi:uncharacterized protein (TIGR02001 family)
MSSKLLVFVVTTTGIWAGAASARAELIATGSVADKPQSAAYVAVDTSVYGEIALADPHETRPGALRVHLPEQAKPESEPETAFTFEANLELVSDYWTRGLSVTAGKPAFQPSFSIDHKSGLHLDFWGSNVADNGGADIEIDAAIGFAHSYGAIDADLGMVAYIYPGASAANYLEVVAAIETKTGSATINASAAYVPPQGATDGTDSIYISAGFEAPLGKLPLTLWGAVGLEHGFFGDKKVDWQIGVRHKLAGFDLGLSYADAARTFHYPDAGAKAVVSISKSF